MADQYISMRNLRFLLHEVFAAADLNRYERYQDYDREAIDMAIDAAKEIGDQYLFPYYRVMDKEKAYYQDGEVIVHPAVSAGMQALGEGGWIAAPDDYEHGGQQMPLTVLNAAISIFYAANANIASYAFLTQGAANLIRSFGNEPLNERYIEKMYAGQWQGTMALTEPQAGSSLSDLTTTATPTEDGHYLIKGQKIYISGGDYHTVENVVHLLLARIEGAPLGTKGISLFVVPKKRWEDGQLVDNHVTTAGIYGKMGQRGYVAAHLMLGEQGETHGYLVGKEHGGLPQMFQMMNEARIGTGLMATGAATAAYYASLQYARERPQGRHPDEKDPAQPQIPIIEHTDVRRMLLYQKAIVEGSASLLTQCSYYSDLTNVGTAEEAHRAHLLLELLTPIAKSFPAEYGNFSVSTAMQVLGGAGYTDDFPIEQLFRDIRVNSIYEGTTTIHGLDLVGRKIFLEKGAALRHLQTEIGQTLTAAEKADSLAPYARQLGESLQKMETVLAKFTQLAQHAGPRVLLADATLFLDYFGLHVIAWQWLKQGLAAVQGLSAAAAPEEKNFYLGKLAALRYFFHYELIRESALRRRLLSDERVTLETDPAVLV
jgi:butyryl-CoA dehydrogenase